MALPPRKQRELTVQMLYSFEIDEPDQLLIVEMLMNELKVARKYAQLSLQTVQNIHLKAETIDAMIAAAVDNHAFERITILERSILRLAIYEMIHDGTVPPKVVISEANRLAKKFSTPGSVRFVNGILDRIYKENIASEDTSL